MIVGRYLVIYDNIEYDKSGSSKIFYTCRRCSIDDEMNNDYHLFNSNFISSEYLLVYNCKPL